MEIWLVAVIAVLCMISGIIFGTLCRKPDTYLEKNHGGTHGILIVDKGEQTTVYSQFFDDPRAFRPGQKIVLEVLIVDMKEER